MIAIIWWLRPEVYNYSRVLKDSLLFFESHRVGEVLQFRGRGNSMLCCAICLFARSSHNWDDATCAPLML